MKTNDLILLGAGFAAGRLSNKLQAGPIGAVKKKSPKKIKISFINDQGYKITQRVTPEELKLISRIINVTLE